MENLGFAPETLGSVWRHLVVTTWGCATGIWWVEARGAGKRCAALRTAPPQRIFWLRMLVSAQAEKPWPKWIVDHMLGMII